MICQTASRKGGSTEGCAGQRVFFITSDFPCREVDSQLIEHGLPHELATVRLDYRTDGVMCMMVSDRRLQSPNLIARLIPPKTGKAEFCSKRPLDAKGRANQQRS